MSNSERTCSSQLLMGDLAEWARVQGVHPQTAYRWFHEGTLPIPAVRVNQRAVLVSPAAPRTRSLGVRGACAGVLVGPEG